MKKPNKTCAACRWWAEYVKPKGVGTCHARPPQAVLGEYGIQKKADELWPQTEATDFCGGFEL